MDDRTMLLLAAKAAGYHYRPQNQAIVTDGIPSSWNPLTDDGDRYRLAKKLDIRIHFGPAYVTFAVGGVSRCIRWPEDVADDAYAIVRAAAAIGDAHGKA